MARNALILLAGITFMVSCVARNARGDVRREKPERRPYITEIGEPYSISMATVQNEAAKINELDEYLGAYGDPDYAEIQEILPEWPWESYEVRLYYLHRNMETDFGHVLFSSAMPDLGVLKFQGGIPPEKRHQIEVILQARIAPPAPAPVAEAPAPPPPAAAPVAQEQPSPHGITEAVVARLEAAAERASQAADRATEESAAAVRAADRTVNIVDKMEQSVPPKPAGKRDRTR